MTLCDIHAAFSLHIVQYYKLSSAIALFVSWALNYEFIFIYEIFLARLAELII